MKRIVAFSLICILLVAAFPSSAEAYITKYDDAKGWWGDDVILYTYSDDITSATYSAYMSDWSAAITSWNRSANMPLTYTYTDNTYAPLTLSIYYGDHDGTFGVTNTSFYTGDFDYVVRSAECFLNLNAIDRSGVTIDDFRVGQSSAAHEIGHVSGLKHDNSDSLHLMNINRNRTNVYLPDQDSINGVIFFYRDWDFNTWVCPN